MILQVKKNVCNVKCWIEEIRSGMKAISIKQPWAWAIIHAGKDVENRTWAPGLKEDNYRGPLLIHASKSFDTEGYNWIIQNHKKLNVYLPAYPSPGDFQKGGIIGRVIFKKLVRSIDYSPWIFGPWGWVLIDPKPIDFIPYKGQLGIFNVPDDLIPL